MSRWFVKNVAVLLEHFSIIYFPFLVCHTSVQIYSVGETFHYLRKNEIKPGLSPLISCSAMQQGDDWVGVSLCAEIFMLKLDSRFHDRRWRRATAVHAVEGLMQGRIEKKKRDWFWISLEFYYYCSPIYSNVHQWGKWKEDNYTTLIVLHL